MDNGQQDGVGSESIARSFSPDISHYLLIVVGEPLSEEYVNQSLADVEKGKYEFCKKVPRFPPVL